MINFQTKVCIKFQVWALELILLILEYFLALFCFCESGNYQQTLIIMFIYFHWKYATVLTKSHIEKIIQALSYFKIRLKTDH